MRISLILVSAVIVFLAACDGGPDEDYCDPCVGEVPVECEDVCSPDDK